MLKLKVVMAESYDETKNMIVEETVEIELEHSLASLSKWEEIWELPLLTTQDKTPEMNLSYLECMCLTPNVSPEVLLNLTEDQMEEISEYLGKKATATWFNNEAPQARSGEAITAELVYYWMSSFQINWEAQYWHLNKLLTLIKVFSVKQDNKPKKINRTRSDMERMMEENNRRMRELGTNG